MKRILVIGCPGSGKSTFSKRLSKALNLPLLHLDRIFHIDNYNQISKTELKEKIANFIDNNDNFIIDGNYTGSLEYRMQYADHVFYFDIPVDICIANAINRTIDPNPRTDIAPGFDNSIIDEEFIDFIKNFNKNKKPINDDILSKYDVPVTYFNNYKQVEEFFENL